MHVNTHKLKFRGPGASEPPKGRQGASNCVERHLRLNCNNTFLIWSATQEENFPFHNIPSSSVALWVIPHLSSAPYKVGVATVPFCAPACYWTLLDAQRAAHMLLRGHTQTPIGQQLVYARRTESACARRCRDRIGWSGRQPLCIKTILSPQRSGVKS